MIHIPLLLAAIATTTTTPITHTTFNSILFRVR